MHEIDCDLPFFDSLREDYAEFNEWYKKSARQGRKAWIHKDGAEDLGAILIYKEEYDEIISDDNKALPGTALKLCTFKVGEDIRGRKIGELFLKAAFRYATGNHIEHIYITVRPGKHEFLEDLCVDFGFERHGKFREDYVYIKKHPSTPPSLTDEDLSPLEYHKRFYPHFRTDSGVQKFIVPIKPIFHEMLFPDNQRQRSFFSDSSVGNAIKQAYLCHARISWISPGDILLFYRSKDRQSITSLGIVEATGEYQNLDEIIPLVSKRTVYSYEEIAAMAEKKTRVILFRLAKHLSKPVRYNWLLEEDVVNGPIQTIRKISNDAFEKIIQA